MASTAPAGPPQVVRVGDVVSFDVLARAPFNQGVQLELSGQGFAPADLGATLTPVGAGNPLLARFRWPVDCRAVAGDSVRVFQFTAVTTPCGVRRTATVSVAMVVRYANAPPVLRPSAPLPPAVGGLPLVRLPLGAMFTVDFLGTDADADNLTLTAGSENFTLAEAGMSFAAQNGSGRASGTFRWDVSCGAVNLHRPLDVTFQLLDATCRPLPQRQTVRFEVETPRPRPSSSSTTSSRPTATSSTTSSACPSCPSISATTASPASRCFRAGASPCSTRPDRDFRWAGQGQAGIYYYLATYTDGRRFKGWLEVKP